MYSLNTKKVVEVKMFDNKLPWFLCRLSLFFSYNFLVLIKFLNILHERVAISLVLLITRKVKLQQPSF